MTISYARLMELNALYDRLRLRSQGVLYFAFLRDPCPYIIRAERRLRDWRVNPRTTALCGVSVNLN